MSMVEALVVEPLVIHELTIVVVMMDGSIVKVAVEEGMEIDVATI